MLNKTEKIFMEQMARNQLKAFLGIDLQNFDIDYNIYFDNDFGYYVIEYKSTNVNTEEMCVFINEYSVIKYFDEIIVKVSDNKISISCELENQYRLGIARNYVLNRQYEVFTDYRDYLHIRNKFDL